VTRDLTAAELVLLGLLAERNRHGYELDAVLRERGMREWTSLAFSSVYYLLRKLERDGLIAADATSRSGAARRRITYALTHRGRRVAGEATLKALSEPVAMHPPVLVGLANTNVVGRSAATAALRERSTRLQGELVRIAAAAENQPMANPVVDALFDHGMSLLRAELDWVARTIGKLEADT